MNRKEFIKSCGLGCVGFAVGATFLQSCSGTKFITAELKDSFLHIPLSHFHKGEPKIGESSQKFRKYVVLQNESLQYPICVYRITSEKYVALNMRCTHQGTELQVIGDRLQCPAHGSEFNNRGTLQTGPANRDLRSFPTQIIQDQLNIDLR